VQPQNPHDSLEQHPEIDPGLAKLWTQSYSNLIAFNGIYCHATLPQALSLDPALGNSDNTNDGDGLIVREIMRRSIVHTTVQRLGQHTQDRQCENHKHAIRDLHRRAFSTTPHTCFRQRWIIEKK
jgi:hypothetical protein